MMAAKPILANREVMRAAWIEEQSIMVENRESPSVITVHYDDPADFEAARCDTNLQLKT